jgi:Asp-tRNA(Asn)/Glu-tRNA(Gln) amidotransferase A subunit family amidase
MIAGRCSILGMGTDIGGSIRFPASFNGIYGLKPCMKRVLIKGALKLNPSKSG